ncbi:MAG: putative manganese-dependent inorganic diphosphatase, partial [Erysipelotrichaceae bacterium]
FMSTKTIYITGHRNPDSDSICSTIAYANLKSKLGFDVTPIRIGNINSETSYILKRFDIDAPKIKYDIKPVIKDIDFDDPIIALENEPLKDVWEMMLNNKKKVAAVVSEQGLLLGIISLTDITNAILSLAQGNYGLLEQTSLENIALALDGNIIYEDKNYHSNGRVKIGSSVLNAMNINEYQDSIVITSVKKNSQLLALDAHISLLIVSGGESVDIEVKNKAIENNISIITTNLDLIAVAQTITQSIPVNLIMTDKLVTFNMYDYIEDVKEIINKSRYRSYPVVDNKGRLVGLISRYHLWNHPKKKIILVDHNEVNQSIEGVEEAQILEIIDHHKLGDVQTNSPIYFRSEICGCTSTIICKLYEENNVVIDKKMAALMCCAIISDTVNFNSPTCTWKDVSTAQKLANICGENLAILGSEILKASVSLENKSIDEIVYNDIKEFNISSYRVDIAQMNILNKGDIIEYYQGIKEYLDNLCTSNRLDIAVMFFTLIDGTGSYCICGGRDKDLFEDCFNQYRDFNDDLFFVKDIISRKQQIVPILSNYLQMIKG